MKSVPHTPLRHVQRLLALGTAALLSGPFAFAQTADSAALRRLQEENAALRARIAELETRAQPTANPATIPAAPAESGPAPVQAGHPPGGPTRRVIAPAVVEA